MYIKYHQSFLQFLEEGNSYKGSDSQLMVAFIEKDVLLFIQQHIHSTLLSIYDERDPKTINDWYERILGDSTLYQKNNACSGIKYSEALNWYKRFLESDFNPDVIARKEAEKERIKQERKELKKKEKEKKQASASTTTTQTKNAPAREKRIKKQVLDENQREGAITQVSITRRERNLKLRQACIDKFGYVCQCCFIDFEKVYGSDIGSEFIEVHHLLPISQTEGEHDLNAETDLVPLCPNCHAMIHRLDDEEMTLDKLKSYYHGYDYSKGQLKDK